MNERNIVVKHTLSDGAWFVLWMFVLLGGFLVADEELPQETTLEVTE